MNRTRRLYIFGWPGFVGGASTKLAHLLRLLHQRFAIVVVPNEAEEINEAPWNTVLAELRIPACRFEHLPQQLNGWGLSLCNFEFLMGPRWAEVRARGLKMAWSNEMMWTHPGELGPVFAGLVDQVLYVSETQRECLEPHFYGVWTGSLFPKNTQKTCGTLVGEIRKSPDAPPLKWAITGNYIDPELFPLKDLRLKQPSESLVIGRLSRADPGKFPEDFPDFYESLGLRSARFRVMAWNAEMAARWPGHRFDERWELLPPLAEDASVFLRSLDLFVYSLGPGLRESWGRCVVEAMLSGAVPILPESTEHHLRNLIRHGYSGFLCRGPEEFGEYAQLLDNDRPLLLQCAQQARADAVTRLCDRAEHLRYWENAFPDLSPPAP